MNEPPLPRLWGIDLARFVAIAGMMAAHLIVIRGDAEWLRSPTSGFPSTLFAVLGGFGLVFAARRYRGPYRVAAAFSAGVTRGAVVLLIGLLANLLPAHPIYVILVYYGAALMLLAPLVFAPTWTLICTSVLLGGLGPFILATQEHVGQLDYSGPLRLLHSVLIGGTYPVLTWAVYMLAGMVLCRWVLAMREKGKPALAGAALAVGGTAVGMAAWIAGLAYRSRVLVPQLVAQTGLSTRAATEALSQSGTGAPIGPGWGAVLDLNAHTGSVVDILRTGGISVAIIGAALLLATCCARVPFFLRPLTGIGAAPLTTYTLHLVMTSFTIAAAGGLSAYANLSEHPMLHHAFAIQMAVLLVLGAYLGATGRRGPLEVLVSRAAQAAARSVDQTT